MKAYSIRKPRRFPSIRRLFRKACRQRRPLFLRRFDPVMPSNWEPK